MCRLAGCIVSHYHNGQDNGEEDWYLKSHREILQQGSQELTNSLAKVLQGLRDEGCDGD